MRIISGTYGGRILGSVPDGVRPATDRVRGMIFNVLQNRLQLEGINVLDIFAGSGSLGFEAISRGAERCTFVDDQPGVVDIIRQNAASLGCADVCTVARADAFLFLRQACGLHHLIFADPPYAATETPSIPAIIAGRKILAEDGYLIIEHSTRTAFPASPRYRTVLVKEAGATRVSFFQVSSDTKGDV
jgi:16S rRNA (guanine966-N2)-methyltransferase